MRIAHFSDIHGSIDKLLAVSLDVDEHGESREPPVSVVVNSGDFMPNCSRGDRVKEATFQQRWVEENLDDLATWIGNRPFVTLMGNHDFYQGLAGDLILAGVEAHPLSAGYASVIQNICFAGFGEIPYIIGEWNGETHDSEMRELVDLTMATDPVILVTHAPPAGILDGTRPGFDRGSEHIGIQSLLTALTYQEHNVKLHLFGHCHFQGGNDVEVMGIRFYNGATTLRFIEV